MKSMALLAGLLGAIAPFALPDPYATSLVKSGKGQGHGRKGTRGKAERNARKAKRKAQRKNR